MTVIDQGGLVYVISWTVFRSLEPFISADSFILDEGFAIMSMVLVGGMGSMIGPTVGAAILIIIPELFRSVAEYRLIIYGLAILLTMHLRPQGMFGGYVMRQPPAPVEDGAPPEQPEGRAA